MTVLAERIRVSGFRPQRLLHGVSALGILAAAVFLVSTFIYDLLASKQRDLNSLTEAKLRIETLETALVGQQGKVADGLQLLRSDWKALPVLLAPELTKEKLLTEASLLSSQLEAVGFELAGEPEIIQRPITANLTLYETSLRFAGAAEDVAEMVSNPDLFPQQPARLQLQNSTDVQSDKPVSLTVDLQRVGAAESDTGGENEE